MITTVDRNGRVDTKQGASQCLMGQQKRRSYTDLDTSNVKCLSTLSYVVGE